MTNLSSHGIINTSAESRLRCAALLLLFVAASCDGGAAAKGTWTAQRETHGDTLVVTTTGGSVWSAATLVEDLRIGMLDGPDELMFGRIEELAPDSSGGVYVFDGQVPALRYYDATGKYVRTLGRSGSGPGEYRDAALGLAVRSDGRVIMRDPRNHRINVYEPDGTPSGHWPVASGLFTGNAMVLDTSDHVYLRILLEEPERNRPWKIGLLHLDGNGTLIDSIAPPAIDGEPTDGGGAFLPSKHWVRSPFGFTVVGVPRQYMFEIRHPDGRVTRVVKTHEPVALLAEERAEHRAVREWMRKNQGQFMTSELPDIPAIKPAYSSIASGADGRIWIRVHVTAEKRQDPPAARPDGPPPRTWIEPMVHDVFEQDGTYLGQVRVPASTAVYWFGRDHLWGVRRGDMDENYVVRMRLRAQ